MFGAIVGDMVGSVYEHAEIKQTDFEAWGANSVFTDDSVLTVATADAILTDGDYAAAYRKWGRFYPYAGYGGTFRRWLRADDAGPYGSWGNGAAMRVSPIGRAFDSLEKTLEQAELSAACTHNHPEGIKGAEATASAIYLARTGKTKAEIKAYIVENFGYDLSRTCDEIRPGYHHVESCQETVPEAITAFLEGESFEDVIRTAVSLGGDCDTLTCIAGAIAEGFYGVPEELKQTCKDRLAPELLKVINHFDAFLKNKE